MLVFQVTVNGLGAAYNLHACSYRLVILGQNTGVGVGIIAAYYNKSLYIESLQNFQTLIELLLFIQLGTA
ncbi:MAG: hypothetical protein BWY95_02432 [Bacteroidetes bacterium ADurb.BinA104]|nr:MAG: hypothetical protein BWY95_02432 [Bacteroidetes bacterium ADurb.BinA104]